MDLALSPCFLRIQSHCFKIASSRLAHVLSLLLTSVVSVGVSSVYYYRKHRRNKHKSRVARAEADVHVRRVQEGTVTHFKRCSFLHNTTSSSTMDGREESWRRVTVDVPSSSGVGESSTGSSFGSTESSLFSKHVSVYVRDEASAGTRSTGSSTPRETRSSDGSSSVRTLFGMPTRKLKSSSMSTTSNSSGSVGVPIGTSTSSIELVGGRMHHSKLDLQHLTMDPVGRDQLRLDLGGLVAEASHPDAHDIGLLEDELQDHDKPMAPRGDAGADSRSPQGSIYEKDKDKDKESLSRPRALGAATSSQSGKLRPPPPLLSQLSRWGSQRSSALTSAGSSSGSSLTDALSGSVAGSEDLKQKMVEERLARARRHRAVELGSPQWKELAQSTESECGTSQQVECSHCSQGAAARASHRIPVHARLSALPTVSERSTSERRTDLSEDTPSSKHSSKGDSPSLLSRASSSSFRPLEDEPDVEASGRHDTDGNTIASPSNDKATSTRPPPLFARSSSSWRRLQDEGVEGGGERAEKATVPDDGGHVQGGDEALELEEVSVRPPMLRRRSSAEEQAAAFMRAVARGGTDEAEDSASEDDNLQEESSMTSPARQLLPTCSSAAAHQRRL